MLWNWKCSVLNMKQKTRKYIETYNLNNTSTLLTLGLITANYIQVTVYEKNFEGNQTSPFYVKVPECT